MGLPIHGAAPIAGWFIGKSNEHMNDFSGGRSISGNLQMMVDWCLIVECMINDGNDG